MIIKDPIYGEFDITEPVLLELLVDPTILRVKGVMQGGPSVPINGWTDFSRFEHCLGAMLIVRTLEGSIEEQIAALLHDVPHTAFSHVIDVVFMNNEQQDYHEQIKQEIIENSMIPQILQKYNFDLEYILNEHNFPLLERKSPQLCADRVDYGLRANAYYKNDFDLSRLLFFSLRNFNNEIVFDSVDHAVAFGEIFTDFIHLNVSDIRNMATYFILADAIRYALDHELLLKRDLVVSDDFLWNRLISFNNEYISSRLNLLTPSLRVERVKSSDSYNYIMNTKKRWVRPLALVGDTAVDVFEDSRSLQKKYYDYLEWIKDPFYAYVVGM